MTVNGLGVPDDEAAIRELVAAWMDATRRGDLEAVLALMTEDVVFLVPGRPPMIGRDAYADAARAQSGGPAPTFDGKSEVQEIRVLGDWAWMWTRLEVVTTAADGRSTMRSGHNLSILRRPEGR